MIVADTDDRGFRTYRLPRALVDVALALFPDSDQCSAVFRLARRLSWHDAHTLENISLHRGHVHAIEFAKARMIPDGTPAGHRCSDQTLPALPPTTP